MVKHTQLCQNSLKSTSHKWFTFPRNTGRLFKQRKLLEDRHGIKSLLFIGAKKKKKPLHFEVYMLYFPILTQKKNLQLDREWAKGAKRNYTDHQISSAGAVLAVVFLWSSWEYHHKTTCPTSFYTVQEEYTSVAAATAEACRDDHSSNYRHAPSFPKQVWAVSNRGRDLQNQYGQQRKQPSVTHDAELLFWSNKNQGKKLYFQLSPVTKPNDFTFQTQRCTVHKQKPSPEKKKVNLLSTARFPLDELLNPHTNRMCASIMRWTDTQILHSGLATLKAHDVLMPRSMCLLFFQ